MANSDVDGGAPSNLSTRGRRVSERSAGRGVGAAGAADPAGAAPRTTAPDRHAARRRTAQDRTASGGARYPLSAAHRLPLALPAARELSAALNGLQHLSQVPV